jgi:hypothetical protein
MRDFVEEGQSCNLFRVSLPGTKGDNASTLTSYLVSWQVSRPQTSHGVTTISILTSVRVNDAVQASPQVLSRSSEANRPGVVGSVRGRIT